MEEVEENIVIVGAGIAGLATSLGLYRLGVRSIVLESSDSLRTTGFGLGTWTNAWKALDALGVGDSLRRQHVRLHGGDHEVRCVSRKKLLEAMASELPNDTVKFSSKVVSIEDSGFLKLVHLADGTVLKTKVLIGCDGVNSVVAKWLGFKNPAFTGRYAIRGCVQSKIIHDFEPKFMQFFGEGVRSGVIPCNDNTMYWFFAWTPSNHDKENEENPAKMKQFVLSKLGKMPDRARAILENTELEHFTPAALRYRHPWELLWGNISKGNVCVAGDAFHPMTPDLGQGGCAALEDGVVLARYLAEALSEKPSSEIQERHERWRYRRIEMGLKKYAKERKWRGIELISAAYMAGRIQQSNGMVLKFLRDKILAVFLAGFLLKRADYDCGKLSFS